MGRSEDNAQRRIIRSIIGRLLEEHSPEQLPEAILHAQRELRFALLAAAAFVLIVIAGSVGGALLLQDKIYPRLYASLGLEPGETLVGHGLRWTSADPMNAFVALTAVVALACALFILRHQVLWLYALLEMLVGLQMIVLMLLRGTDVKAGLTIISGVYLLVRAIDNMSQAIASNKNPENLAAQIREQWPAPPTEPMHNAEDDIDDTG
jgi:hypothetical protein